MLNVFKKIDETRQIVGDNKSNVFEPPKNLPDLARDIYEPEVQNISNNNSSNINDVSSTTNSLTNNVLDVSGSSSSFVPSNVSKVLEPSNTSVPKLDLSLVREQLNSSNLQSLNSKSNVLSNQNISASNIPVTINPSFAQAYIPKTSQQIMSQMNSPIQLQQVSQLASNLAPSAEQVALQGLYSKQLESQNVLSNQVLLQLLQIILNQNSQSSQLNVLLVNNLTTTLNNLNHNMINLFSSNNINNAHNMNNANNINNTNHVVNSSTIVPSNVPIVSSTDKSSNNFEPGSSTNSIFESSKLSSKISLDNYVVLDSSKYFYARNGMIFKSLGDLILGIERMDDDTFNYHITNNNNDFSNWIKHVFDDVRISDSIRFLLTKDSLLSYFNYLI
jgi:hypothetical protein